jgi:hypothetical protein
MQLPSAYPRPHSLTPEILLFINLIAVSVYWSLFPVSGIFSRYRFTNLDSTGTI